MKTLSALFLTAIILVGCAGSTYPPRHEYTLMQYMNITPGQDWNETNIIMGWTGTPVGESYISGIKMEMFKWQNPNGSQCMVTFKNGKVFSKAQYGLQ